MSTFCVSDQSLFQQRRELLDAVECFEESVALVWTHRIDNDPESVVLDFSGASNWWTQSTCAQILPEC
jgi:hypothetical protein